MYTAEFLVTLRTTWRSLASSGIRCPVKCHSIVTAHYVMPNQHFDKLNDLQS
jgi:hypothetical protein